MSRKVRKTSLDITCVSVHYDRGVELSAVGINTRNMRGIDICSIYTFVSLLLPGHYRYDDNSRLALYALYVCMDCMYVWIVCMYRLLPGIQSTHSFCHLLLRVLPFCATVGHNNGQNTW